MIIDSHTHLFPPEVIANHEAFRARDAWFHDAFSSPKIRFASPESMIQEMDDAGIEQAIVVGWPWQDEGLCDEHNAFLMDVVANAGGRLHWLAIVNPVSIAAVNQLVDAKANGAVGIGELNADGQGFDWRHAGALHGFAEACLKADLPILLHSSEPTGHTYPGKGTATPDKIVEFATAFPELRIVAAHWGGGLPFYELMPEVRAALRNVWYDTSASTYLYRFDVFDVVMQIVGADRVLFGSDFPVLAMKRFTDRVRGIPMTEDDRIALFAGNAQRLFGLSGAGGAL